MRKYSKKELESLKIVSESHHTVYSDGEVFFKQARSDEAASEIVLEYTVQKILGFESRLIPGPPVSLLTPNYGAQLTGLDSKIVRESVQTMYKTSQVKSEDMLELKSLAPTVNDFRDKVESKLAWRVANKKNPTKLFKILPEEENFNEDSLVLCHCDPRPENWLRNDNDELILIDWESAVLAPWEFAVASYASYVYEYGRPDLLEDVFDEAKKIKTLDLDILQWSAELRRVSVCSWYYDDEGYESGDAWLKGQSEAWRKIKEIL